MAKTESKATPDEVQTQEGLVLLEPIVAEVNDRINSSDIFSRTSRWKREINPISNWGVGAAVLNDYTNNSAVVDEIYRRSISKATASLQLRRGNPTSDDALDERYGPALKPEIRSENQRRLQILSLSAKNRAESLSDRADFYPVFITLLTAVFAFIFYTADGWARYIGSFIALVFVANAVFIRVRTKSQVAQLKVLANVLDLVDKRFPKAP